MKNIPESAVVFNAIDNSIFITGSVSGSYHDQPDSGNSNTFLSKYITDGERLWTVVSSTSEINYPAELVINPNTADIFIPGDINRLVDGQTVYNIYLSKYSAATPNPVQSPTAAPNAVSPAVAPSPPLTLCYDFDTKQLLGTETRCREPDGLLCE